MSFASESGYIPLTVNQLMSIVRQNVNAKFLTTYSETEFLGTGFYKYFYALIQRLQENEVKTAEIFQRLQEYFAITNEKLSRPNTTAPGIYDYFLAKGYFVSVKPPLDEDAGKVFICVDVDSEAEDYEDVVKPLLGGYVRDCVVAGVISQGTEEVELTLSNSQAFTFKYNLPIEIPVDLRLTLTLSENNQFSIGSPDDVKQKLLDNIAARYQLGKNFEPQRYFSIIDAPWAGEVLLEWDSGSGFSADIYESEYNEVFTFSVDDIEIVEA